MLGVTRKFFSLFGLPVSSNPENCFVNNLIISADSTGAKFSKLELNPRATLASSKQVTLDIVAAPDWNELRSNATVF